jgi:hypothetical protein
MNRYISKTSECFCAQIARLNVIGAKLFQRRQAVRSSVINYSCPQTSQSPTPATAAIGSLTDRRQRVGPKESLTALYRTFMKDSN